MRSVSTSTMFGKKNQVLLNDHDQSNSKKRVLSTLIDDLCTYMYLSFINTLQVILIGMKDLGLQPSRLANMANLWRQWICMELCAARTAVHNSLFHIFLIYCKCYIRAPKSHTHYPCPSFNFQSKTEVIRYISFIISPRCIINAETKTCRTSPALLETIM